LVAVSIVWNVVRLHHGVYDLRHGYSTGTTSELIRMTEHLPASCQIIFVERTDAEAGALDGVMDEYGITDRFHLQHSGEANALDILGTMQPPFAVFTDLADAQQIATVERAVAQRFPDAIWQESDTGKPWNLRYVDV